MSIPSIFSPELLIDLRDDPKKVLQVLISCNKDLFLVSSAIKKAGIHIAGKIEELDILQASINYNDLDKLQKLEGIEWVEADQEVGTY